MGWEKEDAARSASVTSGRRTKLFAKDIREGERIIAGHLDLQ
jgi:hypothetical protein